MAEIRKEIDFEKATLLLEKLPYYLYTAKLADLNAFLIAREIFAAAV